MSGVVVRKQSLLGAVGSDELPEISLAVQKAYAHDRDTEIAGRLELIACHVAEAAGIDGQSFAQHEFHAEVGNRAEIRLCMRLLKPGRRLRLRFGAARERRQLLAKLRVIEHLTQTLVRHRSQYDPRIVGEIPQLRFERVPERIGRVIPGPAQIQGKAAQHRGARLDARWDGLCAQNDPSLGPQRHESGAVCRSVAPGDSREFPQKPAPST